MTISGNRRVLLILRAMLLGATHCPAAPADLARILRPPSAPGGRLGQLLAIGNP